MHHINRYVVAFTICFYVVCFTFPSPVLANSAAPPIPARGKFALEPNGVESIHIVNEVLNIDMRPLFKKRQAEVEVIYDLDNVGTAQELELIFATGSPNVAEFEVWIDDTQISTEALSDYDSQLPESWMPPESTPGLGSRDKLSLIADIPPQAVRFFVDIPQRKSQLTVRYKTFATQNWYDAPVITWQFVYILAPARSWASFGNLSITLDVPPDWEIATAPTLERQSKSRLTGNFDGIPADAIAISTRKPVSWLYEPAKSRVPILYPLVAILGLIMLVRLAITQTSLGHIPWRLIIGKAFLWGLMIIVAGFAVLHLPALLFLGNQGMPAYGYAEVINLLAIVAGIIAMLIYFVIGAITALLAHWQLKRLAQTHHNGTF